MTRVKICGITRLEDAELAIQLGASALGFVLDPASPRKIDLRSLGEIIQFLPPFVSSVAVFGHYRPEDDCSFFDAVQAVDSHLYDHAEHLKVLSAYRVGSGDPMPDADTYDALLIDAYSPDAFGGTGLQVDLDAAKSVLAETTKPAIVAGGLNPENVGEVIAAIKPFAVDVSSSLEDEPGTKSPEKMKLFFEAVSEADSRLF